MNNLLEVDKKKSVFQILFLKNDKEKYVEAYETNNLSCSEIIKHLNHDESVFISNKKPNYEKHKIHGVIEDSNETLYLNRY
jgi:hypothetical protein